MKTMNKILLMSAVTFAMAAVSPARAGEPLLSPRAKASQTYTAVDNSDFANRQMAQNGALLSPRAQGNQIAKVAGINNDPDLVLGTPAQTIAPRIQGQQPVQVYPIAPVK
jgi:hypothetical protein